MDYTYELHSSDFMWWRNQLYHFKVEFFFFPFYEISTKFSSYVYLCAELLYQQSSIMKLGFASWNRLLHYYHATLTIKDKTQFLKKHQYNFCAEIGNIICNWRLKWEYFDFVNNFLFWTTFCVRSRLESYNWIIQKGKTHFSHH